MRYSISFNFLCVNFVRRVCLLPRNDSALIDDETRQSIVGTLQATLEVWCVEIFVFSFVHFFFI